VLHRRFEIENQRKIASLMERLGKEVLPRLTSRVRIPSPAPFLRPAAPKNVMISRGGYLLTSGRSASVPSREESVPSRVPRFKGFQHAVAPLVYPAVDGGRHPSEIFYFRTTR